MTAAGEAQTAINGLLDLLSSEDMRNRAWERDLEPRVAFLHAWRAVLDALNPALTQNVLDALRAQYEAADEQRRAPWTLERVEQFMIDGASDNLTPIDFYFTYCSPRARGDQPAIPINLYRQAWRNVIEREAIHVSPAGYVTRGRKENPIDADTKATLLAFTFEGYE